ncbi:MAG: putative baseplate assembly protein [Nitrospira sp.]|nr:putative baseplate assembly protein [Nitrospira sp.]
MSGLAPNLFDRRFQDFMDMGRARLPSLAPEWTDHNAHDPGITLMELLAWTAEAQLYGLARMRRDERLAYAAMLGLLPAGTRAPTGYLWSDRQDPSSPVRTFAKTRVIAPEVAVNVVGVETPSFRPMDRLLWVPGKIVGLKTHYADGRVTDHTMVNEQGRTFFLPFGRAAGRQDVLSMEYKCRDDRGIFSGMQRKEREGARLAIGIQAALPHGGAGIEKVAELNPLNGTPLDAVLVVGDNRLSIKIVSDSTQGFLATGVLLLDLDHVESVPQRFTIELRARNGFPRPPRLYHLEPNVIPITQGQTITREPHEATGLPDWSFMLEATGLRFARGEEPLLALSVAEPTGEKPWYRCDRLSEQGPQDDVYEFNTATGEVTFGNGINGRLPPRGSLILVSYAVSEGEEGSVARNRQWRVAGFDGVFGVNLEPISGGASTTGWIGERREARRRSTEDHALVSKDDLVAAALALPLLEVARAWVPKPDERRPRTGEVRLVALRSRASDEEPKTVPETKRWLEAIRRRLMDRMPLGSRLVVMGPGYVEFSIRTVIETHPGRNPAVVKQAIETQLRKRLAVVDVGSDVPLRQPGVPVTQRDLAAWIRATDGVKRVVELRLMRGDGRTIKEIRVSRSGLPRWDMTRSIIDVKRPAAGGVR